MPAPTSSIVTGGVTISAATVEPAVQWALSALAHAPVPESVSVLVTGLVCAAAHAVINRLIARNAIPAAPQQ
ncbi:hypothetical protein [Burkholderia pseudomultivorans]|uniref:hypothetical protein n=1 Tax=Burkholderia pseudomultivorans TaxID=1207504 RepID=UPI000A8A669C|nr:hypothetical protein [Burkholderia pseudomultivorans]